MTQSQLGRRIGTSDVTVRRWEIGIHKPIGVYVMLLRDLERELDSGAEMDAGRDAELAGQVGR
jgi:DNA-binding transcriptional regulator YiaG